MEIHRMRIGLFGGSFDPIHLGHLLIAEAALEALKLDEVRWIPAATSPLKRSGPVASNADRLEMLRLALAGSEQHVVDDCELRRGGVSFTIETLAEVHQRLPEAALFLIVGSDSLATWREWRAPDRILSFATLAVVQRGGEPALDFSPLQGLATPLQIDAARRHVIPLPVIELSSSELRQRVALGQRIRFRTPHAVEALIKAKGLYRSRDSTA